MLGRGQEPAGDAGQGRALAGKVVNSLVLLAMAPLWLWVAVIVLGLVIAVVVLATLALDGTSSEASQDWHYQCDSAIGPDPSDTETAVPTEAASEESVTPSPTPTVNPYAGLTFSPADNPSAWDLACAGALPSAPYQQAPLQTAATGFGIDCARQVALAYVGTEATGGIVALTQDVTYQGAVAASTGHCSVPVTSVTGSGTVGAGTAATATTAIDAAPGSCSQFSIAAEYVLLPSTIAAQGLCGQRVATSAISSGDLVFWGYSDNAPTRAGVALGPEQIVTVDSATGRIVQETMPTESDVRVKRMLEGGS